MEKSFGLVHAYTGIGKGKTTSAIGLALRAIGHNLKIYIIQFLKSGDSGELFAVARYLPNIKIVQFGKEAITEKQSRIFEFSNGKSEDVTINNHFRFLPDEEEKEACRRALEHAAKITKSEEYNIVILDEVLYALEKNLIKLEDLINLIKNKNENIELILTGGHKPLPEELLNHIDLVTEMKKIKHYFDKNVKARAGIEY